MKNYITSRLKENLSKMDCGWPGRLGFSILTPLDKFEAQPLVVLSRLVVVRELHLFTPLSWLHSVTLAFKIGFVVQNYGPVLRQQDSRGDA